jgi:hypothetical protein
MTAYSSKYMPSPSTGEGKGGRLGEGAQRLSCIESAYGIEEEH